MKKYRFTVASEVAPPENGGVIVGWLVDVLKNMTFIIYPGDVLPDPLPALEDCFAVKFAFVDLVEEIEDVS